MESSVSEPRLPAGIPVDEEQAAPRKARKGVRRIGTGLIAVGIVALAFGATVYFWHDPVTDLWARWKQQGLAGELEQAFAAFDAQPSAAPAAAPPVAPSAGEPAPPAAPAPAPAETPAQVLTVASAAEVVAGDARRFRGLLEPGDAVGRLVIPKLGIDPVFVNGTEWSRDLSQGPGLYPETKLPGLGQVAAIAGHRTTFGAWFRKIDTLKGGDPIDLVLPYGTFHYRVVEHEIVDDGDWSILEPRGFELLVLSACHPLYAASERWIVYAKLVGVDRPDGSRVRVRA